MLLDLRTVRLKQLVTVKQAADELSVARQTETRFRLAAGVKGMTNCNRASPATVRAL